MFEIKYPFGVELEFSNRTVEFGDLARTCEAVCSEFSTPYSRQESADFWTLKDDPSCGHEFTSPRLEGEGGLELLRNVAVALQARHPGVNMVDSRCGLHVHLDIGDLTRNDLFRVAQTFARIEPFLYSVVPTSRRGQSYVRSISDYHNCNGSTRHIPMDHYQGANFCRWMDRGTIEIRYGGATCSGKKISNWVRLLQGIVAKVASGRVPEARNITTQAQFWAWMGEPETEIDLEVKAWVAERIEFFQNNDPETNRRHYLEARQVRDRIENVAMRQYHYFLRREMTREQRREHDRIVLERHNAGTLLEWEIPEAWLAEFYEEHPEHRPEGNQPSPECESAGVGQIEVDDEVEDEMVEELVPADAS